MELNEAEVRGGLSWKASSFSVTDTIFVYEGGVNKPG